MNREALIARVADRSKPWSMIVIGGGATGLGTAVDAASRGYRTLLLEQSDFAKGTSSRSTKLIHGGLRYLRQGNLGLVRESLRERGLLLRNAPHLVRPLPFVIPTYRFGEDYFFGFGVKLYDWLAGKLNIGPSRILSREEVLHRLPGLNPGGLRGGVLYFDAQFDDARLALTLARTLHDLGGAALNYVRVVSLKKRAGKIFGVVAEDTESGRTFELDARVVVNATGVFSDAVRQLDDPEAPKTLAPSQGSHLVLDASFLPGETAVMIPKTDDGRVLFAIPWHGRVLVGTTDVRTKDIKLEPNTSDEEIDYLLVHIRRYLTRSPTRADILCVFAGLRPLVSRSDRPTSKLPRDHVLDVSESGLVSIVGGKWTTYRQMAEETVERGAELGGLVKRASRTPSLRLHGWTDDASPSVYGSDAVALEQLATQQPALGESLHPNLPYRGCEVVWAARHELARTVEDVLARRTRALLLDCRASLEIAPRVAALMARELGRDETWCRAQVAEFTRVAENYCVWQ